MQGRQREPYHLNGTPPEDHPRRCQHKAKGTGERCKKWALRDARFCRSHRGRYDQRLQREGESNVDPRMFYKRHLRQTMRDALQEALDQDPSEQIQLYEELALCRMSAGQAVALWDAATAAYEAADEERKGKFLDATLMAGDVMRSALREVRDTAEKISTMQVRTKGYISVHDLQHWVNSLVVCVYRACGDNEDIAIAIEQNIRTLIKLPDTSLGTTITPDQDVLAMDDTVPNA